MINVYSSTETSELDGSIRGKQAQVAKLQEEILVLSIKKDKVSEDMEKVLLNQFYVGFISYSNTDRAIQSYIN